MLKSLRHSLSQIACLMLVPTIGVLSAYALDFKLEQDWFGELARHFNVSVEQAKVTYNSLALICAQPDPNAGVEQSCFDLNAFGYVRLVGYAAAGIGILIVMLVLSVARIARDNRHLLAMTFNPTVKFAIALLCVSVLLQGATLAYLAYALPAYFVGYIMPKLILVLGFAALAITASLVRSAFGLLRQPPMKVAGLKIDSSSAPGLVSLVSSTAERLEARKPDNIVVGMEPNFFVTAASVQPYEDSFSLSGVTLYVSLPLLRLLNRSELSAVLGHELGHFKGGDLSFSMKFAPAYASLHRALNEIGSHLHASGTASLMALPAFVVLTFVYEVFARAERAIGRTRELAADKIGALASSSEALVSALLKVSEYSGTWNGVRRFNCKMLSEGKVYADLSKVFIAASNEQYAKLDFGADKAGLLASVTSHPTDTHPTLSERLQNLGVDSANLEKVLVSPADVSLTDYFVDPDRLAETLSTFEHRLMVALGYATIPKTAPASN